MFLLEKLLDSKDIQRMMHDIQEQDKIFRNKAFLDGNAVPSDIIGREKEAKELVRHIMGYKKNFIVPLISVSGRSGSGKSTLVKFVCDNLQDEILYYFVNLRKAKTIFGSVNLILGETWNRKPQECSRGKFCSRKTGRSNWTKTC